MDQLNTHHSAICPCTKILNQNKQKKELSEVQQLYTHEFDNVDEVKQFLKRYKF